jgi:hypothetical protein
MPFGWQGHTGRGSIGVMNVPATLAPQAAATFAVGSMRSIDGVPLLVIVSCILQINNSANASASAFKLQAPFPSWGPFSVLIEPSLNNFNFGVNYFAPANTLYETQVTGLYTNLTNFGVGGPGGPQVNQGGPTLANFTVTNLNSGGGNSFGYFIGGWIVAVPLNWGDLGGFFFE